MDLLITLILGGYVFSAGSYIFTWSVYRLVDNHRRTELKHHMNGDCGNDCYYCEVE
jgi:hypothetical protein